MRWVKPEHLHLTLKFLGNVRAEQLDPLKDAITAACTGLGRFDLTLNGGLGCFPNAHAPRVVWLGIGGDVSALRDLQHRIEVAAMPFSTHQESERHWQPHLTIGRIGRLTRWHDLRAIGGVIARKAGLGQGRSKPVLTDAPLSWTVEEFDLFQSTLASGGPVHTCLERVNLS